MSIKDSIFDDGHGYITFGWIGTIIGLLLFGAIAHLHSTSEKGSSYYAQKCAQKYEQLSTPPSEIDPSSSQKETQKSDNKQESDPNWCDLAAQYSMAQSTVWINRAAWATVVFTVTGMFLIWRTLVQTGSAANFAAKTLDEARKATKAANKTVKVTREIGQAQVRAYVSCDNISLEWNEDTIKHVVFKWENNGQSPASKVMANCYIHVVRPASFVDTMSEEDWDDVASAMETSTSVTSIGANSEMKGMTDSISAAVVNEWREGQCAILAKGTVTYFDVFDRQWDNQSFFRFVYEDTPTRHLTHFERLDISKS